MSKQKKKKKKNFLLVFIALISVLSPSSLWKILYQQECSCVAVCFTPAINGNHYHLVPGIVSHYWRHRKQPHHIWPFVLCFLISIYTINSLHFSKYTMFDKAIASIKVSASQGDAEGLFQRLLSQSWPTVRDCRLKMLPSVFQWHPFLLSTLFQ